MAKLIKYFVMFPSGSYAYNLSREIESKEDAAQDVCPKLKTEIGEGVTYNKFINYVNHFLKPYMEMEFVEEEYYKDVFDEIWANQNTVHQLPRGHSKTEMVGIWLLTVNVISLKIIKKFSKMY